MKNKAFELYKQGKKLCEIAEELEIPQSTVRQWKRRYEWDVTSNKKKQRERARILIEEGCTLREAEKLSGVSYNTLIKWSSKENLQQNQLEYLKQFREECRALIRKNKVKRLELNAKALEVIEREIMGALEEGGMPKSLLEKLKLNEEIEQMILAEDRIEKMERLELDKERYKKEGDTENKVTEILDRIKGALND